MKKVFLSWSLVFLLAFAALPCAYAAEGNLGVATVNEYYSCTVSSVGPLTLAEGSQLPPGFELDGSILCGTPAQAGDYDFTVTDGSDTIHCTLSVTAAADPNAISSISVNTVPTLTRYSLGSQLDTAGLTIDVNYAGGHTETITEGFGYYPMLLDAVGEVPIEVSYHGFKCYFNVNVTDAAADIGGIGLVTLPSKMTYKPGEEFQPSGIVLRVYRLDKSHYDIDTGYSYSPSLLENEGEQTVTLSYEGKSCTFTVSVAREDTPSALYVAAMPTKTTYTSGESLNTAGLALKLVMSSGATQDITSGFSCYPVILSGTGSQTINVSYGTLSCVFNVTVMSASPSPSPSPTPTPTPTAQPSSPPTPTLAPTPHVIEHQAHNTPSGTGLLTTVLITSLVLLAALGGYVFIVSRGGWTNFKSELRQQLRRFRRK